MLVAAALVIPAVVIEATANRAPWPEIALALNWIIWTAFAVELVWILWVAPNRWAWARAHPLEVAIVVLTPPFGPAALQSARALRLLRLLRLMRLAKLARGVFTLEGLRWIAVLTVLLLLAGGAAFSVAERGHHNPPVSAWDGLWWGVVTVTTVGYGDITPVTAAGRAIGTALSFVGIGFVAMLTAAAAERFARRDIEREPLQIQQDVLAELRSISERLERLERREP